MIPKIIHYCWMSGEPYPIKIQKCIESWKRVLPDYEIWLWDTERFDITKSVWVEEAFKARKYAFCADYLRLYALYHYGGLYLDSDVEVVKSYNDLLHLPYFIGLESKRYFEAATIGAEPYNAFIGDILKHYENRHFISQDGEMDMVVMPEVMMKVAEGLYEIKVIKSMEEFDLSPKIINVFEYDWFSPIDSTGKRYVLRRTEHTYSIHHFASAWVDWKVKLLVRLLGLNSPMRLRLQGFVKKACKTVRQSFSKKRV